MTRKPFGTVCRLGPYSCGDGPPPQAGEYLRTRAGSAYEVLDARPIGGDPRRLRLTCVRTDPAAVPTAAVVHPLFWDSRAPRGH